MAISEGKRALVTGACGFSAGYVIDELLKEDWTIRVTDLKNAPRKSLEKFRNKIEFISADLTDKDSLKPIVKDIDIVFHTAALYDYSSALDILRAINVQGTKNLIDVCMKENVQKIVSWSSATVYGHADPKHYRMPITEDQELNPKIKEKYGISKREQEAAAMEYYNENGYPISFLRCAPIYGPGSYYGIYLLFKNIRQGILVSLPRNFNKTPLPLIHVEDIARSALFLSEVTDFNGETYNIADDNHLNLIQSLRFIATHFGKEFGVTIPFPKKFLTLPLILIAKWSKWEANHLRKKENGKPPIPKLERDLIEYFYGKFYFSNQKIKDAGFKFKYPDRTIGLIRTLEYYEKNGWDETHHY